MFVKPEDIQNLSKEITRELQEQRAEAKVLTAAINSLDRHVQSETKVVTDLVNHKVLVSGETNTEKRVLSISFWGN